MNLEKNWIIKDNVFVIDNFFKQVDSIREYALNQSYFPPEGENWIGFRTKKLSFGNLFVDEIILTIAYALDLNPTKVSCYFHYTLLSSKDNCTPSFDEYKFHSDGGSLAGVIYLNPNPQPNTGTTIFWEKKQTQIENLYNRFLCYNSKLIHGPTDVFGDSIENSRLTLTFFV